MPANLKFTSIPIQKECGRGRGGAPVGPQSPGAHTMLCKCCCAMILKERVDYFNSELQTACSNPAVAQGKYMRFGNFQIIGSFGLFPSPLVNMEATFVEQDICDNKD